MAPVTWAPEAFGHLAAIRSYLAPFSERAADRLVQKLQRAGNSLDRMPYRGRPVYGDTRELVTVRPYAIRYEILDDRVRILSFRHTCRRRLGTP